MSYQVTEWPSDQVTKWPSDQVTKWPSDRVTEWQEASQTIDRMEFLLLYFKCLSGCSDAERAMLHSGMPEEVRLSKDLLKYYTMPMARWHDEGDKRKLKWIKMHLKHNFKPPPLKSRKILAYMT